MNRLHREKRLILEQICKCEEKWVELFEILDDLSIKHSSLEQKIRPQMKTLLHKITLVEARINNMSEHDRILKQESEMELIYYDKYISELKNALIHANTTRSKYQKAIRTVISQKEHLKQQLKLKEVEMNNIINNRKYRVFEEDSKIKCISIYNNYKDVIGNTQNLLIITSSLTMTNQNKCQLNEEHCLKYTIYDDQHLPKIEIDPNGQYILIVYDDTINIINRKRLNQIGITEMYHHRNFLNKIQPHDSIKDMKWFYNHNLSPNLLLCIVFITNQYHNFIVYDCETEKQILMKRIDNSYIKGYTHVLQHIQLPNFGAVNDEQPIPIQYPTMQQEWMLYRIPDQLKCIWGQYSSDCKYIAQFINKDNKYALKIQQMAEYKEYESNESKQDDDVYITFNSKPLGMTWYPTSYERCRYFADDGRETINARVFAIKPFAMHYVENGLSVGLYIHSINNEIMDNIPYADILHSARTLSVPITVGFKSKLPDPCIVPDRFKKGEPMFIKTIYNEVLNDVDEKDGCNGLYWLNDDSMVFVMSKSKKLYIIARGQGCIGKKKVLNVWMNAWSQMGYSDIRALILKYIEFHLDYICHLSDLKEVEEGEECNIDFCLDRSGNVWCVYQDCNNDVKFAAL